MAQAEALGHRDGELIGGDRSALEQHLADLLSDLDRVDGSGLDGVAVAEAQADDDVAQARRAPARRADALLSPRHLLVVTGARGG